MVSNWTRHSVKIKCNISMEIHGQIPSLVICNIEMHQLIGRKKEYIKILKNKRFVQWMKRNVDGKSFWEKKTDDKISIKINNNRIKVPTMRFKLAHWNWYVLFICADWLCVWALFSFALPFSMCVFFFMVSWYWIPLLFGCFGIRKIQIKYGQYKAHIHKR